MRTNSKKRVIVPISSSVSPPCRNHFPTFASHAPCRFQTPAQPFRWLPDVKATATFENVFPKAQYLVIQSRNPIHHRHRVLLQSLKFSIIQKLRGQLLQPLIIHREALLNILMQPLGSPTTGTTAMGDCTR